MQSAGSYPRCFVGSHPIALIVAPYIITVIVVVMRVLALSWISGRFYRIVTHPSKELSSQLSPQEIMPLEVLIEQVGDSWVSIYWHHPSLRPQKRKNIRRYVVVCGKQQIDCDSEQSRLIIQNLTPKKSHKVTVYAVVTVDSGDPVDLNEKLPDLSQLICGKISPNEIIVSSKVYFRTHDDKPRGWHEKLIAPPQIELSGTPESVLSIQKETQKVIDSQLQTTEHFNVKLQLLTAELDDSVEQRKLDEAKRTQLRAENRALENDLHALELQTTKIKDKSAKAARYMAESQAESLQSRDLDMLLEIRELENKRALQQFDSELQEIQKSEQLLDSQIHEELQAYKQDSLRHEHVQRLIERLKSTNNLENRYSLIVNTNEDIDLSQLAKELRLDATIEHEWGRAHNVLEQKYEEAYHSSNASLCIPTSSSVSSVQSNSVSGSPGGSVSSGLPPSAQVLAPAPPVPPISAIPGISPDQEQKKSSYQNTFSNVNLAYGLQNAPSLRSSSSVSSNQNISGMPYGLMPSPDFMSDTSNGSLSSSKKNWLPWIHRSDTGGSRRTQSLFFNDEYDRVRDNAIEEEHYHLDPAQSTPANESPSNPSSPGRSPKRTVGSFFQKGGARSGSFASRFGFKS